VGVGRALQEVDDGKCAASISGSGRRHHGAGGDRRCHGDGPTTPKQSGSIAISPRSLSLTIGGTGSLTTTVKDAAGAVVPGAGATWVSRKPAIATVDNSGKVAAVAVGTTTVVGNIQQAVGLGDRECPTVTASCNGIPSANTFPGTLDYDWVGVGTTQGGFVIHSEHHGNLKATLTRISATATQATWAGDATGTASVEETKAKPYDCRERRPP
jgi:hypothetical protein